MLNVSRQQAFLLLVLILFIIVLFAVALVGVWVSLGGPMAAVPDGTSVAIAIVLRLTQGIS